MWLNVKVDIEYRYLNLCDGFIIIITFYHPIHVIPIFTWILYTQISNFATHAVYTMLLIYTFTDNVYVSMVPSVDQENKQL